MRELGVSSKNVNSCRTCSSPVDLNADRFVCGICSKQFHWACADFDDELLSTANFQKYSSHVLITCNANELPDLLKLIKAVKRLDTKLEVITADHDPSVHKNSGQPPKPAGNLNYTNWHNQACYSANIYHWPNTWCFEATGINGKLPTKFHY